MSTCACECQCGSTGLCGNRLDIFLCVYIQVAAVSGDARRALDIARRATEIAQSEKGETHKNRTGLVGIPHVDRAVQEMFSSAKIQAIR